MAIATFDDMSRCGQSDSERDTTLDHGPQALILLRMTIIFMGL